MKVLMTHALALALGAVMAAPASASPTVAATADRSTSMPQALQPAFYAALADDASNSHALDANGCATIAAQTLEGCFQSGGVAFRGANAQALDLRLVDWGRGEDRRQATAIAPRIDANEAHYDYGTVTEWWKVLPLGFEQGFTFDQRPAGDGEVTLQLASSQAAQHTSDELGWGALRYGKLVVTDAKGRVLPASLRPSGERIVIAFDDRAATYPVVVDPLVWIEQKVAASDGVAGEEFGYSVAVSGNTALIGAAKAGGSGATYVFQHGSAGWSQVARLGATDAASGDAFGYSVALSGSRALIGARAKDGNQGAAYVFEGSGATWTQTAKLVAGDGAPNDRFGSVVALSGDNALVTAPTAAVGANASQGAGYVFNLSGGAWSQAAKLVAADGVGNDQLGIGGALDGTTAMLGTPNPGFFAGATYVFEESGGGWSQTQRLSVPGGPFTAFGSAIDIDGSTAVIGGNLAMGSQPSTGAAWIFTRSGGSWTMQQKIAAADGEPSANFGVSVAIDGDAVLVGADGADGQKGATYLFENAGGTWSQLDKLAASDATGGSAFGTTVAKSGNAILVGARAMNVAYFYNGSNVSADPVATVTPTALAFAAQSDASDADVLTIGNTGGSMLTYSIQTTAANRSAVPTSHKNSAARRQTAQLARTDSQWQRAPRSVNRFGKPFLLDDLSISQMADNTPGDEGVSCGEEGTSTADNSWWRRFYFNEHAQVGASADIKSVTVSSGSIPVTNGLPVTVNLYSLPHATPVDTIPTSALTLIGSATATITQPLESITIPVTGTIANTAGSDLVVELHTEGNPSGGQWFPGANSTPETHPSFLSSTECEVDEPTPMAAIGFADSHMTMVVALADDGAGPSCENVANIPWLNVAAPNGTVEPGRTKTVSVVADALGMAAGQYHANLCVATNDPVQPQITVPVSLTVSPVDAIFCSGFENGESGHCGPSDIVTGVIDELVNADEDGSTLDLVTGLWGTYDGMRMDDINLYDYGDGTLTAYFYGDLTNLAVGSVADASGNVAVLQSGAIVGPGSTITNSSFYLTNWLGGADGYLGIAFQNEETGQLNYGYIHMTTTAPMGFPARVIEYAYDKSGAAIRIP